MQLGPQVTFEIQAECPVTRARAGVLHTAHGDIETPVFMPVGTQATVKGLSQRDLAEDLDVGILLGNTYHLYLRPGHELIRHLGGLHRFMSWPRAILTDSGGFQVFSLAGIRKITEQGVVFSSHLDGDPHTFTPQSTVDVQLAFGSDILMALDECPEYPVSHEYARQAMPEWKGRTEFESPQGRVVDHVGFSVENLGDALEKLRKEGVTVTSQIKSAAGGKIRYAFIEGPDKIRIELVEGQAHKE